MRSTPFSICFVRRFGSGPPVATVLAVLLLLLGSACSTETTGSEASPAPTMRITEDGYDLPDWDGSSPLTIVNDHTLPAGARIYRLDHGAGVDSFLAHLAGDFPGVPPFEVVGGPERVEPGATVTFPSELPAGTYFVASFEVDDDAWWVPQFITGHLAEFTIG